MTNMDGDKSKRASGFAGASAGSGGIGGHLFLFIRTGPHI